MNERYATGVWSDREPRLGLLKELMDISRWHACLREGSMVPFFEGNVACSTETRAHPQAASSLCFIIGLGQRWCISYAFAVVEVGWQTGRVVNEADRAVGGSTGLGWLNLRALTPRSW